MFECRRFRRRTAGGKLSPAGKGINFLVVSFGGSLLSSPTAPLESAAARGGQQATPRRRSLVRDYIIYKITFDARVVAVRGADGFGRDCASQPSHELLRCSCAEPSRADKKKRAAPPCNRGGAGTSRCRGSAAGATRIARVMGELKIQNSFVPRARSCCRTSGETQPGAKGATLTSHPATLRAGAGAVQPSLRPAGIAPVKRAKRMRAPTVRTTTRCGARKQHPGPRSWCAWMSARKSAMSASATSAMDMKTGSAFSTDPRLAAAAAARVRAPPAAAWRFPLGGGRGHR